MFHALVGEAFDTSTIVLIAASVFLFLMLTLSRRESERFLKANVEFLTIPYDVNATYDLIVKQIDEWRQNPFKPNRISFASFRLRVPRFEVHKSIPPRLYRIIDRYAGVITFELTPKDGGGTVVKISYSSGSQDLIKEFKTKLRTLRILV